MLFGKQYLRDLRLKRNNAFLSGHCFQCLCKFVDSSLMFTTKLFICFFKASLNPYQRWTRDIGRWQQREWKAPWTSFSIASQKIPDIFQVKKKEIQHHEGRGGNDQVWWRMHNKRVRFGFLFFFLSVVFKLQDEWIISANYLMVVIYQHCMMAFLFYLFIDFCRFHGFR